MPILPSVAEQVLAPLEACARLGIAAVLGGAIGLNRERRRGLAGLRTHTIVALGSAAVVLFAADSGLGPDARSRVMQGILQGVGFLGAGTIVQMSHKGEVRGLTTASTVWFVAVLGIGAAVAPIWLPIAATATALLVLGPLEMLERRLERTYRPSGDMEPREPDEPL
ncbi:MAG: MgtC/SapB family protein [Phycisphaerales bacterium]